MRILNITRVAYFVHPGEKPSMIVGVADDDAAEDAVLQPAGVSPTVLDPLEPYRAFYRQALHSKEALEAIR